MWACDIELPLEPRVLKLVPAPEEGAPVQRLDWESLYREHARQVGRWAARLGGPTHEIEDVVQEVFLVVQRQLPKFRGDSQASTWLFGITENVCRQRRRKQRLKSFFVSVDVADIQVVSTERSPADLLEQRDAKAMVYRALDKVSERYRSAFVLFEIEGMSGEEIANLLGVKLSTLWVWLHRARAQFLKAVDALGEKGRGA